MNRSTLIAITCSSILAVVFFSSGIGKLLDTGAFAVTVMKMGLPGPLVLLAPMIAPFEIVLAIALIVPKLRRIAALTALISLALFTGLFFYGVFFGHTTECGCFGFFDLPDSPAFLLVRNLALAALAALTWVRSPKVPLGVRIRPLVFLILILALSILSVMSIYEPFVLNTPVKVGQRIQESPLKEIVTLPDDRNVLLFFYNRGCPECWDSMENVKAYRRTGTVDQVIGFTVGSPESLAKFERDFSLDFETRLITVDEFLAVTQVLPVAYFARAGSIYHVEAGKVRSPVTFKRLFKSSP